MEIDLLGSKDDVNTGVGDDGLLGHLAHLQAEGRLLKRFLHLTWTKHAEVPTLLGGATIAVP